MTLLDQAKPAHDPDLPGGLFGCRAEADGLGLGGPGGPGGPGSACGRTAVWTDAGEDQCGRPAAAGGGGAAGDDDDDQVADFDCGLDALGPNWTSPDGALPLLKEAKSIKVIFLGLGKYSDIDHK